MEANRTHWRLLRELTSVIMKLLPVVIERYGGCGKLLMPGERQSLQPSSEWVRVRSCALINFTPVSRKATVFTVMEDTSRHLKDLTRTD